MISPDCLHMLFLVAGSGVAVEHNDNRCAWISDLCASTPHTHPYTPSNPPFHSTADETQQVPDTIPPQKHVCIAAVKEENKFFGVCSAASSQLSH